jgi:hypothetical protein
MVAVTVAAAKRSRRCGVISSQSLVPRWRPTAARTSSSESSTVCAIGASGQGCCELTLTTSPVM